MQKTIVFAFASVGVDYIGKLLKGIKADAKGQKEPQQRDIRAKQPVDIFYKKVKVFEIKQQTDIEKNGKGQDKLLFTAAALSAHSGYQAIV